MRCSELLAIFTHVILNKCGCQHVCNANHELSRFHLHTETNFCEWLCYREVYSYSLALIPDRMFSFGSGNGSAWDVSLRSLRALVPSPSLVTSVLSSFSLDFCCRFPILAFPTFPVELQCTFDIITDLKRFGGAEGLADFSSNKFMQVSEFDSSQVGIVVLLLSK